MLTSLDLLVILCMGLAFVSLLSLALMFLIKNKVVRYITMGLVLTAAAAAAFFGFMVGLSGCFMGQAAIALLAFSLIAAAIVLSIIGAKRPKLFLVARIIAAASLVLGMLCGFYI